MDQALKKILLVDDESIIALYEKELLEERGYNVSIAFDGDKAAAAVESQCFDLILMDIDLGKGKDGTEVAREILKTHDLPIIFLSSHTETEVVHKTEMITSYGYVVKDSGIFVLDASIKMAFKLYYEIRDRKRTESDLIKTSTEMQLVLQNMLNAFIIWESVFDDNESYVSFKFGYFNDAYSRISGLNRDDVIGKDVRDVWPETEQSWIDTYGKVAVTGIPDTFEMFHKPTNGWYLCKAYRPTDSSDNICVIFEDVTDKKTIS